MTIWGIVENLVADVIFIILAIIASGIWVTLTNRRKLQLFFHTLNTKRLTVYLSAINVLPFGATGESGKKLSYQGHAVAYGEMLGANQIKNLFGFIIPKLSEASQTIGKLFLSDVTVQTVISPYESKKLDSQASFVVLGSPAYNGAAAYIESLNKGGAKFQFGAKKLSEIERYQAASIVYSSSDPQTYPEPGTVTAAPAEPYIIPSGQYINPDRFSLHSELIHAAIGAKNADETKESAILVDGIPPITDTTYGFIERILDSKKNRAFFYVAGLSEFGTKAATYYLASQWFSLYKKYREDKPFIIMLRFDTSNIEKWSVVFEKDLT